jgi:ribose 1,5-bisphosphate isomerase
MATYPYSQHGYIVRGEKLSTSESATARLDTAVHGLRNDRVHGAMELAVRALDAAADLLIRDSTLDVRTVARALATARPSMAAIANAVTLTLAPFAAGRGTLSEIAEAVAARKASWRDDTRMIEHSILHIPKDILTYSHASTTRIVLLTLRNSLKQVVIPEGRPVGDGKRLAEILAGAGIPVTVITEAQMGWWVPQVEAIVVGADTVTPAGDVINHMGTATLALIARQHNVPIYSLTHTLKIAPYDRPQDLREENDPAEIWPHPPPGIAIRNPAFDRTPADQITVITECGMLTADLRERVIAEHRAAWEVFGLDRADAVSS